MASSACPWNIRKGVKIGFREFHQACPGGAGALSSPVFMSTDPASLYSRKNPFPATHPVNRKLSGEGSGKDTRHHEVSLVGSGLNYEVGDSMGLFATNDPALVQEIITALGATGEEEVPGSDGVGKALRQAP